MGMGERIKSLRAAKGLSQRQLAKLIKISQASLSLIESNDSTNIRATTLAALAMVLSVNPEWLQHGTGNIAKPVQVEIDHTEVLAIYDHLTQSNRDAWMTVGRTLLNSQPDVPPVVRPYQSLPAKQ